MHGVERTTAGFFGVVANIRRVSEPVTEIGTAFREPAQGLLQIKSAVNEMDRVTQRNAVDADASQR